VCEELDFSDKKERLGEQGKKYVTMLSSWAYSEFFKQLNSLLSNRGIELITVNPAYYRLKYVDLKADYNCRWGIVIGFSFKSIFQNP
jgi:hypothetical protein